MTIKIYTTTRYQVDIVLSGGKSKFTWSWTSEDSVWLPTIPATSEM